MRSRKSHRLRRLANSLLLVALCLVGCATARREPAGPDAQRSPSSPAPQAGELGKDRFVSRDGAGFPYTRWAPPGGHAKTVIVAVHGLSGAASDFRPLGEYFAKLSTATYGYELRGQGNDPDKSRVGDIEKPELWFEDLDTFLGLVRAANPKARLFLYGESLGGLISIHGMETLSKENRDAVRGLILASPVVSLKDRETLSRLRYLALQCAIRVLPRRKISLGRLAAGKQDMLVAAGTDHRENMSKTPHAVGAYSFRLLGTLERLIDGSRDKASQINKPILVLYPAHDLLTTAQDVDAWFASLTAMDKEKRLFAKSYHLLLHDVQRDAVIVRVRQWIERH